MRYVRSTKEDYKMIRYMYLNEPICIIECGKLLYNYTHYNFGDQDIRFFEKVLRENKNMRTETVDQLEWTLIVIGG